MKIKFDKTILLFGALLVGVFALHAQTPEKMSYQAVVRNSNNALLKNMNITIKTSILSSNETGEVVYTETQNAKTNENGLVSIEIGSGTTKNKFSEINWSSGVFFLKTEIDPTGGDSYTISFVNQLLSVPYAMYAKEAGTNKELENRILSIEISMGRDSVADYNNNYYKIVQIGKQFWFARNLLVENYNDGSLIPTQYRFTYNDLPFLKDTKSGFYYKWDAVATGKLCPKGWHVPTKSEWNELRNTVNKISDDLKITGSEYWYDYEFATNKTGFSAFPSGLRNESGEYVDYNSNAYYWLEETYDETTANYGYLNVRDVSINITNKENALSIRCIKD